MKQITRKIIAASVAAALAAPSFAAPAGGSFGIGAGAIGQSGNTTNVNITGTNAKGVALINWSGGFNVAPTETVAFTAGTPVKHAINVDTSGSGSLVNGTINVSGMTAGSRTLLVNPNGVTVGNSARVIGASNSSSGPAGAASFDVAVGKVTADGVAGTVTIDVTGATVTGALDLSNAPSVTGAAKVSGVTSGVSDGVFFTSSGATAGQNYVPVTLANDTGAGLEAAGALVSNKYSLSAPAAGNWAQAGDKEMAGVHLETGASLDATGTSNLYLSAAPGGTLNLSGTNRNVIADVSTVNFATGAAALDSAISAQVATSGSGGADVADITGSKVTLAVAGSTFGGFSTVGGEVEVTAAGALTLSNMTHDRLTATAQNGQLSLNNVTVTKRSMLDAGDYQLSLTQTTLTADEGTSGLRGSDISRINSAILLNSGRVVTFSNDYHQRVFSQSVYGYTPTDLGSGVAYMDANFGDWGTRSVYKNAPVAEVTATGTKVYNGQSGSDAGVVWSYSLSGISALDLADSKFMASLAGGVTRAAGNNVGSYNTSTDAAGSTNSLGYTLVGGTKTGGFTITPATVSASLDAGYARTYDGTASAPGVGYSFTGAFAGDALTLTNGTLAFDNKNVGTSKSITWTGATLGGASAGNYTLANTPLATTGDITPAALTVSANAAGKVFGSADPALGYGITSGQLFAGDSFTGSLARAAGEDVGTYAIGQGSLSAGSNYNLTFADGTFTIAPKPVVVVRQVSVSDLPPAPQVVTPVAPVATNDAAGNDDQAGAVKITLAANTGAARGVGVCKK